jgi:tryptophan synthase alpha chain
VNALESALRGVRAGGGKSFVPYVTGGYPGVDTALLLALQDAGADAIEVGIPHSDPIMDGGVIQEASARALADGATPARVLATIAEASLTIPVAVMTYANPIERRGAESFLDDLVAAGVTGVIVPDLPVDESAALSAAAASRGVDVVLLAAPGTAEERIAAIAAAAHGFVYCVATYGVTGAREELAASAEQVVAALRPHTDLPLLVGVGIAVPDQATAASSFADGVIVGSALMAGLVAGERGEMLALARRFRTAI